MSLAEDHDFQEVLEARGVGQMLKRYRGDNVRELDHARCVRRHTKARLARGRAHLVSLVLPKFKVDWDYLKGPHGGGRGKGLPHGRLPFLRSVWLKYYARSQ